MKKLFILITLLACLINDKAKCDNVIINGRTLHTIFFSPFDNYPGIISLRKQLKDYRTGCTEDNCSFLSTWKIVNRRLMLVKIGSCECNDKKQTANLKSLFGSRLKNGMLEADLYSGEIWITKDQPNSWAGMFAASWPGETRFIVKHGHVLSVKNFVYPKPVETVYAENTDSLNKFIYTHINLEKIHQLPLHSNGSYFRFDQDADGYLINVKHEASGIPDQTFDGNEMGEINRVLGLLKWPLFYYHGQPVKRFNGIVIVFSKGMQDKFAKGN